MLASILLLGGLLPVGTRTREQWPLCGAWRFPVGDAYAVRPDRSTTPGVFFVLRGVEWEGARASHQGADLGCGHAGGVVRAAAAGVVVRTADHGAHGGYGTHIVLAHRLPDGKIFYSVYAHLRLGSIRVKPGRTVQAGAAIGRVGATGRATTPHLHFEVRRPSDPEDRWEFSAVEDPLAFVDERLPAHRTDADSATTLSRYLEWGEYAALISPGARADDALTRATWWRMLASGTRGPSFDLTLPSEALRDSLVEARLLPVRRAGDAASEVMEWSELASEIGRVRGRGMRTGLGPLRRTRHRALCVKTFGTATPLGKSAKLSARPGKPTLAHAVLLLADLAGPYPEPPKPKPKPKPAAPDSLRRAPADAPIAAPTDTGS